MREDDSGLGCILTLLLLHGAMLIARALIVWAGYGGWLDWLEIQPEAFIKMFALLLFMVLTLVIWIALQLAFGILKLSDLKNE